MSASIKFSPVHEAERARARNLVLPAPRAKPGRFAGSALDRLGTRASLALCAVLALLLIALPVSSARADFGFLPGPAGFSASLTNPEGSPLTQAGSHPYQLTVGVGFNTREARGHATSDGAVRDLTVDLPPGIVVDPAATATRCTEAQLEAPVGFGSGCPPSSAVGTTTLTINIQIGSTPTAQPPAPVYNMVAPPGSPAELGFQAAGLGIYVHLLGAVRSGTDYGLSAHANDILAKAPVDAVSTTLWGDPSDPSHDAERGECSLINSSHPGRCFFSVPTETTPFLTMPSACSGPLTADISADSWQQPGAFVTASSEIPAVENCSALSFEPTIAVIPEGSASDTPTGLHVGLHVPQPPQVESRPGQALGCGPGAWGAPSSEEQHPAVISFAYRWLRNGVPISGATSQTYVATEADPGTSLQCEVIATSSEAEGSGPGRAASAPFAVQPMSAAESPIPAAPTIGIPGGGNSIHAGETIACEPGAWGGAPSFAYQWFENGSPLPGQTAATFFTGAGGAFLQCEVIGTNAAGGAVAFSSTLSPSPLQLAPPPASTQAPHVFFPEGDLPLATANLRDAKVTLPKGLTVNPAAADGLAACSSAEIELHGPQAANCPEASKVGTVEVDTPLLEHPLPGAVYLAAQNDNPFNSLLAIYIAIDDPQTGVVVKLAGQVEANPETGQLTTTFFENPQLPFEDFKLDFFGGPRAALVTPPTCGSFTTTTDLTPWSSPEGADATPSSSFELSSGPNGSACAATEAGEPNHPAFEAGTTNASAGAFSPFVLHLKREDGSQTFKALNVTLPPGLSGKLAGVGECSEVQLAQAAARGHEGQGALEKQSPSCPASSELGTVNVGAGAGPDPYYVQGHAYLAGPYKGAPLSMAIITPAVAGPFDLGTVVVRAGLYVNPETAQITVRSDPIPQILDGIPLDVRSIAVNVSRNQFTLNPTNCNPLSLSGEVLAAASTASVSNPFQVGGCAALPFKPKLALKLKGGTKRNQNPALTATLTAKAGEANIARAQVTLPHSEFLDNAHIATVCTRVQFAAGNGNGEQCPAASVYGHAKATSPLLEAPLQGPVYLRSSDNQLPDLVAALNGQISVDLDGKVDTGKGGGIRNTFEVVPDAPVSKFVLSMQGGKKGLLVNSENLCSAKTKIHATVSLTGQNGKVYETTPVVANGCAKKIGAKPHKRGGR